MFRDKKNKLTLVMVSFLGLFMELFVIRWLPAHVFSLAFFTNTVLISAFFGLGIGLFLVNYRVDLLKYFFYIFAVTVAVVLFLQNIRLSLPNTAQTWLWIYYEGNRLIQPWNFVMSIPQIIIIIFFINALIFSLVGQKIGILMKGMNSLTAYTLNISGSLLGVFLFSVFSALNTPPYLWFAIIGMVVLACNYEGAKRLIVNFIIAIAIVSVIFVSEMATLWSPYQAIKLLLNKDKSIFLYVNQLFHQQMVNFDTDQQARNKYLLPYACFRPQKVLIIGAGTGNDVWAAAKAGAKSIDAVEIDPLILKIGEKLHPQHPYGDRRVKTFVDDARSFMSRSNEEYDMIIYGTVDSHAMLSVTSSVRLDNYVYTYEGLQEARRLLSPTGVVVLLFSVPTEWLGNRLIETVCSAFGDENTRFAFTSDDFLFNLMIFAGPGLRNLIMKQPDLDKIFFKPEHTKSIPIPKDNWPYLYLQEKRIPILYLTTLLPILLISIISMAIISPLRLVNINVTFFLLGCGFLLLEAKSVTTFSLLFGSTWVVNAVVFASILSIALLANLLVGRLKLNNTKYFYIGLILSLVFLWLLPIIGLLKFNLIQKILLAGVLTALPILFSSFVFAIMIKQTKAVSIALGSNLLGAVVGGFFEYFSMVWGLNVLYLIALGCYVCSLALTQQASRVASRVGLNLPYGCG